jgi:general stress protein YciG
MNKEIQKYLSEIGRKGGKKSKRVLTPEQARDMVRIREQKRRVIKSGEIKKDVTKVGDIESEEK